MNVQLEEMALELELLRSKSRFLTDEADWLRLAILRKEEEVRYHEKNPATVHAPNKWRHYPENEGRDQIAPIQQEIDYLQEKRTLVMGRLEAVKEEASELSTLLDRCRRHAGAAAPERHVSIIGQTSAAREFSPYL